MTEPSAPRESRAFERSVLRFGLVYAAVLCVICAGLFGPRSLFSAPLGAGLGLVNMWLLARGVRALLAGGALSAWAIFSVFKLALLGLSLLWLLRSQWVSFLPFALGLLVVPVALASAQLFTPSTLAPSRPSS